jgi:MerR family transcriptional regulator, thiopeptide resistance regulator
MSAFRIQEFAKLAGVTVRALHHYDRLKLLSPAHRSERGYRLYCHEDLGRLERILVLRFLGLSLREIAALLNAPAGRGAEKLIVTLARQKAALCERRDAWIVSCGPSSMHNCARRTPRNPSGSSTRPS